MRDRSLVTVTALLAQGLTDSSFRYHLECAKKNGITRDEIAEILTHAAFYAGWPKAWAAFRMATEVWKEDAEAADAKAKHAASMIFPVGQSNDRFSKYFTGNSYLAPISVEQVGIYNVTFEPGCRNNWHIHCAQSGGGQILICVSGKGFYQEWGKKSVELLPGSVVNIPVGIKTVSEKGRQKCSGWSREWSRKMQCLGSTNYRNKASQSQNGADRVLYFLEPFLCSF